MSDFAVPVLALLWLLTGVVGLTALVGMLGSRGVLGRPPLAVLRQVTE